MSMEKPPVKVDLEQRALENREKLLKGPEPKNIDYTQPRAIQDVQQVQGDADVELRRQANALWRALPLQERQKKTVWNVVEELKAKRIKSGF